MRQVGATLHRGAQASHYRGLSCCRAQAPDAQAQQLWFTGPVAPRHVGSSHTRARTRVPCIGRQILNHCAMREVPWLFLTLAHLFLCSYLVFCIHPIFPPPYLYFRCSSAPSRSPLASLRRAEQRAALEGVENKLLRHCLVKPALTPFREKDQWG